MKMELAVDSKPKEHPSARICRQLALRPLVAATANGIAVDDKLWQRLLAGHYKAIGAKDFHRRHHAALARSMCTSNALDVADGSAIKFHRSIPGVRSRDSQPTTVVRIDMGTTKAAARVSRPSIERHWRISRRAQSNCPARPPCLAGLRVRYRSVGSECRSARESFRCLAR
jgi:hypothetical protein